MNNALAPILVEPYYYNAGIFFAPDLINNKKL